MNKCMNKHYSVILFCLSAAAVVNAQEVLTDPTRPALYAKKLSVNSNDIQKSEFNVSQIYTNSKKRLATINGQKVSTGEWVEDAQVIAINTTSVDLLVNGKLKKISIIPSFKRYKK